MTTSNKYPLAIATLATAALLAPTNLRAATPVGVPVTVVAASSASGVSPIVARTPSNRRLARLELFVDGARVRSCSASPCRFDLDTRQLSDGAHTIKGKSISKRGLVRRMRVTMNVRNHADAPTVVLNVPATASGEVTILTTATSETTIDSLELNLDGQKIAEFPSESVSYDWDSTRVANGRHTLEAVAVDTNGNEGSTTTTIEVDNSRSSSTASSVTVPSTTDPIELLVGPLVKTGTTAAPSMAKYDQVQVTRGREFADGFPVHADDIATSNYYDLALVLYQTYYRTGDSYWLDRARSVARTWRDDKGNQSIEAYLNGDWSLGAYVPPARAMATLGLAVFALESNDAEARNIVHQQARWAETYAGWDDQREVGYKLIALVASTFLGDDHAASAKKCLDLILANQKADGRWEATSTMTQGKPFTMSYMTGILMQAMVLYDRAIGDARILPALLKSIDWTWNTQWVASAQGFRYSTLDYPGVMDTIPSPLLSGLIVPAWGYAYYKTGDPKYLQQGNAIFQGLVDKGTPEIMWAKQYTQVFRSATNYVGFTQLAK